LIAELLNDTTRSETEIYFEVQRYYEDKYGKNAVVFWESNGSKNSTETYVVEENLSKNPSPTNLDGTFSNIQIGIFRTLKRNHLRGHISIHRDKEQEKKKNFYQ
jgi:hypothetical protein